MRNAKGQWIRGQAAENKGIRLPRAKERAERFAAGLPIYCPKHGEHSEWAEYKVVYQTFPAIRCARCGREASKNWIRRNYLHVLARSTRRRDKASEIDEDFLQRLLKKQDNRCALSGVEFDASHRPSIDRRDSMLGYTKANVQLVLFEVNRMKTDLPLDVFLLRCRQVADYAVDKTTG